MKQAIPLGLIIGLGFGYLLLPNLVSRFYNFLSALGQRAIGKLRKKTKLRMSADLAICEISGESQVANKLIGLVTGIAFGGFIAAFQKSFGTSLGSGALFGFASVGGMVGFLFPDYQIQKRAHAKRRTFLHSFSSFLDLTNILLAGGAGTETALVAAANSGDGWAFDQLRRVLTVSRSTRTSPWVELARLGDVFNLSQVKEIAGSIQLAGEHGAKIRTTLATRAESLRYRQMSDVETAANAATERMGLPMVLLFVSFIVLVGYPAVTQVMGGL